MVEFETAARHDSHGSGIRKDHDLGRPRLDSFDPPRDVDFFQKSGGYFLPVKIDVCRRAGIVAGDDVSVTLELL